MSSDDLENSPFSRMTSAERLLYLLKTKGRQSSAVLGAALKITCEGARQQLVKLGNEGFVKSESELCGVGRPQQMWELTEAGHQSFPDRHSELAVQPLIAIRNELGEEALQNVVKIRELETISHYREHLKDAKTLYEKVRILALIRSNEGYMAECIEEAEEESCLLIENHCPICAVAKRCVNFCLSELSAFKAALGDEIVVSRIEHIPGGARRCAYRISRASRQIDVTTDNLQE